MRAATSEENLMADRPNDARYAPSHEWARLEDGVVTLGITDFAVEHLGDLVFIQLPDVGDEIEVGSTVCEVESVKAVGEVYSPVGGEVIEINEALTDDPSTLASDPFGDGWLCKIRTEGHIKEMMTLKAYESQLESEV